MRRLRLFPAVLVGGLAVVIAAVAMAAILRTDRTQTAAATLRRPAVGEVRPDHLADGTPVWVIGHLDGSVEVLSGFDTHTPSGLGKLLWWCRSARALENPHHGSKWDEYGARIGGPAPTGLPSWEVTVEGNRVRLGDLRPPPTGDVEFVGPPETERDWCPEGVGVLAHTFEGWPAWDSPARAVEEAPDRWIMLDARLVVGADGAVRLCALGGCEDAVMLIGVTVPRPDVFALDPWPDRRFLARVEDGELVDLTRIVDVRALPQP
jgi:hypothetical protein